MAGLSQLLNPSWYQLSYDELSPEVRALVDSGAFQWGSTTSGGDDPKTMEGWQVRDYSKIPTFADGTYFDNSNRDFNVHAGSWTDAGSWDNIVDQGRVYDDPNFGRVTTTDNAYDNKGIGDFMEKVVIGTILGGAGLMGAGMAGFAVPSWVTGAAGAAEGAGAGALSSNILQGFGAGTPAGAGAVTTGGEILTGLQNAALGGAAGGAAGSALAAPEPLSAADAYAVASGGQTPTPFTSSAGGMSLTDAAKIVQRGAGLLGGGEDPAGAVGGPGGGGGGLLGGGGMGGGNGDYFMGLLRKYYGLA